MGGSGNQDFPSSGGGAGSCTSLSYGNKKKKTTTHTTMPIVIECNHCGMQLCQLTVSLGAGGCTRVGGASPPHVSHDCSVTSEDASCDLLLEPTPIPEPTCCTQRKPMACTHSNHIMMPATYPGWLRGWLN